jgi:signal transduction histidine kinase
MKKKLLILFIPITLSILGIIYFQIDWISKTYDLEFKKINTTAGFALKNALEKYHKKSNDSLANFLRSKLTPLIDHSDLIFSNDSLIINLETQYGLSLNSKKNPTVRASSGSGRIRINFPSYNHYNDRRLITEDDLKVMNNYETIQRQIYEIIPSSFNSCQYVYSKTDSIKIAAFFTESLLEKGMADLSNLFQLRFYCGKQYPPQHQLSLGTPLMKYNPQGFDGYSNDSRWVSAYFQTYSKRIISQMLVGLSLSILLIITMILCFIILIKIIIRQKRIAEMKDNYINNMTHELKTPIATISAALEGMQNFKVLENKEKTQRYLNISRTELVRLSNLVSKILNISIYDRNEIELVKQEVDLKNLIHDTIDAEKLKEVKDILFNIDVQDSLPNIQVDPIHFRNVLTNLIDNAVKYSHDTVEINISCYQDDNRVYIKLQDNGIGIASSQLKQIFDKFFRVSTGNVHNIKGYGLGLYYVKYIIERHGGSISVKSEINKGSEFVISIPLI